MKVTFKMIGGPWDGEHVGEAGDDSTLAGLFEFLSTPGKAGQGFSVPSSQIERIVPKPLASGRQSPIHFFEVMERRETEDGIYLTAKHTGAE